MSTDHPTLSDLAARLDVLEHENQALKQQLARVITAPHHPAEVTAGITPAILLDTSPTTLDVEQSPLFKFARLSRRRVLRRGMQLAAATATVGVLLHKDEQRARADEQFGQSFF